MGLAAARLTAHEEPACSGVDIRLGGFFQPPLEIILDVESLECVFLNHIGSPASLPPANGVTNAHTFAIGKGYFLPSVRLRDQLSNESLVSTQLAVKAVLLVSIAFGSIEALHLDLVQGLCCRCWVRVRSRT